MNALRILRVAEELAQNHVFQIHLKSPGHFAVREECTAQNALEIARTFRPDLILIERSLQDEAIATEMQVDNKLRGVLIAFATADTAPAPAVTGTGASLARSVTPAELLDSVDALVDFQAACAIA